jgi:hypothetical protein
MLTLAVLAGTLYAMRSFVEDPFNDTYDVEKGVIEDMFVMKLAHIENDESVYMSVYDHAPSKLILSNVKKRLGHDNIKPCPPSLSGVPGRCEEGYMSIADRPCIGCILYNIDYVSVPLYNIAIIGYSWPYGWGEAILIKVFGGWRVISSRGLAKT